MLKEKGSQEPGLPDPLELALRELVDETGKIDYRNKEERAAKLVDGYLKAIKEHQDIPADLAASPIADLIDPSNLGAFQKAINAVLAVDELGGSAVAIRSDTLNVRDIAVFVVINILDKQALEIEAMRAQARISQVNGFIKYFSGLLEPLLADYAAQRPKIDQKIVAAETKKTK